MPPYTDIGTSEESNVIEIEVEAHMRRIKRKKYLRTCQCSSQPIILTAPQVSKVLSKSHLGNSIWVHCLVQKFWHGQPLYRVIQELHSHHLPIPAGTICGGFSRLLPLLNKLYQLIVDKSLTDKHWHADETGWKVFETLDGKANHRWFLWVFRSNSAAVFIADPRRSAAVVESFFRDESRGTISCDRYCAYFCFVSKSNNRFSIAYCWAHVRRDFLAIAKDWLQYESWGMDWVKEIRNLYHLNNCRTNQTKDSPAFNEYHKQLRNAVKAFKKKADNQLENIKLPEPCRKALESLNRHWKGLTTFVENAEIPMDNNKAERALRGGAIGRKNYYGAGSLESARLTANMFTIIQTLLIWGLNPQKWFSSFFAFVGSTWDKNFEHYLPWNMSSEQKRDLSLQQHHDPPP
jgi:transposase